MCSKAGRLDALESAEELVELLRGKTLVDQAVRAARQGEGAGAVADENVGKVHTGGGDASELDGCRRRSVSDWLAISEEEMIL